MFGALILGGLVITVAPANDDVGIEPHVAITALGAGLGAIGGGVGSGVMAYAYYTSACGAVSCRDNPAFIVAPQAAIFGALAGGLVGGLLSACVADGLGLRRGNPEGAARPPVPYD